MKEKFGATATSKLGIGIKNPVKCKFDGEVTLKRKNTEKKLKNTIQTALKNESIYGVATGTFKTINGMNFIIGATGVGVSVQIISGGTGGEDYITFRGEYTNQSSSSQTITQIQLLYADKGVEIVYSIVDVTETLEPGQTLIVEWKITFSLESGTLQPEYRYNVAKMLGYGTFNSPNKMIFIEPNATKHYETATLEGGGTGSENWARWYATFTATDTVTIDIIDLCYNDGVKDIVYTSDDIVDKTLTAGQYITFHVTITHN